MCPIFAGLVMILLLPMNALLLLRQNGAGYSLGSDTCGSIASGNSVVFAASADRYLVIYNQPSLCNE